MGKTNFFGKSTRAKFVPKNGLSYFNLHEKSVNM